MSAGAGGHAALMDKVYRRQRYIYDLTRRYFLFGRDRLLRELGARSGESVVEIGCGTARNLIRAARAFPGVRLYGLDASREMLRTAEESVRRGNLNASIVLAQGYAEEMTPALFGLTEPFDHAIFSYSLSMIPDWRAALVAAARAVKPEGLIHVVDFGDLRGLWPPAERGLRAWLKLFHVAPRDELLAAVERTTGFAESPSLHVFRGRYAFMVKARPAHIPAIVAAARA